MRRNPVETGFSVYRNEFAKLVRFTHSLVDIGHYYGQYARVMAHWERVAGDAFMTIQYEDFVTRFDEAARELIAYCGLDGRRAAASTGRAGARSARSARCRSGAASGRRCAPKLIPRTWGAWSRP